MYRSCIPKGPRSRRPYRRDRRSCSTSWKSTPRRATRSRARSPRRPTDERAYLSIHDPRIHDEKGTMKTTTAHDSHTGPAGRGAENEHPLTFFFRGLDRFFFHPSDPTALGLIRISAGLIVLYVHLVYCIGLMNYLGPDGWIINRGW